MQDAEDFDAGDEQLRDSVRAITDWLALDLRSRGEGSIVYEGATSAGNHVWRVDLADGAALRLALTEPVLFEPIHALADRLVAIDWTAMLRELAPEGLLVSGGWRFFAWNREKDRGTRMLEWEG